MALPHYHAEGSTTLTDNDVSYTTHVLYNSPTTPIKSNLFQIVFFDEDGKCREEMGFDFFCYQKEVLERYNTIILHFRMMDERLDIYEKMNEICQIEIKSFLKNGDTYLIQSYEVTYKNFQITQSHNDDDIQTFTAVYKIIEENITWI